MRPASAACCCILALFLAAGPCAGETLPEWLAAREVEVHGFVDARAGIRLRNDPYEKDASLNESRLQLDLFKYLDRGSITLKGDLTWDGVNSGATAELREASLLFSPRGFMDIKLGRQTLTWGTGDLLFINDPFPKDWESFFIGRDSEYLKVPSDALKVSLFSDLANIDLVYMPVFNGSRYIDGRRLSYWNPAAGRRAGRDLVLADDERNRFPADGEWAARLYRTGGSVETALYAYSGFWKTPEGMDAASGAAVYPRLSVYGASVRGPMAGGIANLEVGYYDSRQDLDGADPLLRNSEWRLLVGFERELAADFTAAAQYYLEGMIDHDAYRRAAGALAKDARRHVVTLRLTRLLLNQNLKLSLFAYLSPSDEDGHLRPNVHYQMTDRWSVEAGGNLFFGRRGHTFFGQFENNSNLYTGLRWSF